MKSLNSVLKNIKYPSFFLIILFIWISLFPEPIQQKYSLFINSAFIIFFLCLFFIRRFKIFFREDFSLWLFVVLISFNVFFAFSKNLALSSYLNIVIPLLSIYYIVSRTTSYDRNFLLFCRIVSFAGLFVAFLGIADFFLKKSLLYEYLFKNPYYLRYKTEGYIRAISTQFHPSALGTYLLACIPFSVLAVKKHKGFIKGLAVSSLILSLLAIVLTFSRGVFLSLLGAYFFFILSLKKRHLAVISLLILALMLPLGANFKYPLSKLSLRGYFKYGDSIISPFRAKRIEMAREIIEDHPFVGLGLQNFRLRFYDYYPGNDKVIYEFMIPDNMYLTLLTETGLLGFCAFLFFIASFFVKYKRALKILRGKNDETLVLILIFSGFFGLLVNMGAYELFYWPGQFFYFCIYLGLIEFFYRSTLAISK